VNAEIATLLAQIYLANCAINATPTGEPCRCPEGHLCCICGAYNED